MEANTHLRSAHSAKPVRWRVIHACEYARDILTVVEGQVTAGMRPYLVTPQGAGTVESYLSKRDLGEPQALSLLRAWQDVRNWRKSLLDCDPQNTSDLVHAHSFASGMAGVRNLPCVVYDLRACIEEFATSAGLCDRGSWMGRSFHVAEQFILSRAQAVIVHSLAMKSAAEERGAAPENVFLIPDPLPMNGDEFPLVDRKFASDGLEPEILSYFVPCAGHFGNEDVPQGMVRVLEAFAMVVAEIPQSQLLVETPSAAFAKVRSHAERLGVGPQVLTVEQSESAGARQASTVIIATGDLPDDIVKARHPNEACLQSLAMGKPLLAADVPRNRDASPEGRGCLWFVETDVRDLARRMTFLGQQQDFRATLAAAGRAHILETRNSAAIGKQYDSAYRHAISRKKAGGAGQQANSLLPLNCSV